MPKLKQEKKLLLSNKNILRLKKIFFSTPIIMDKNNFTAAKILVRSSKSKYSPNSSNQIPIVALSLILGLLVGTYSSIYVVANMLMSLTLIQEDLAIPEPEGADFDELP